MGKGILIAGFCACLMLSLSAPARAQGSRQYEYKLSLNELPIGRATVELSRQTGRQTGLAIAYYPSRSGEENVVVGPLAEGRYKIEAALHALLNPQGFTFEWVDERTINIVSPPPAPMASGAGVRPKHVADDEPRSILSPEQRRSLRAGGAQGTGSSVPPDSLEYIIVTGTRLASGRAEQASAAVFDRRKLATLGVSSVADLLKYIPQQPFIQHESYRLDGAQSASVRGIGLDTTLVLVNGRRMTTTASTLANNSFDLNSIPLPAIERVEVVSDSAAAVYGADAIGGVVNIILRRDVAPLQADVSYGGAEGGGEERRASFTAGGDGERFSGSIVLDWFSRAALLGIERDLWRDQDFRRFGGRDWRSPATVPGNVTSAMPGNLPGLPASFATVPAGSTGVGLTAADFVSTAGQRNLQSPLSYWSVVPEAERRGALAQATWWIERGLEAFTELLYADRSISYQVDPAPLVTLVPASNPYNPFGVPVMVSTRLDGASPRSFENESELSRAVLGLRTQGGAWNWELSLVRSEEKASAWVENEFDMTRVNAAIASTNRDRALNPFRDGPAGSAELLDSLRAEPNHSRYRSDQTQAMAYTQGPLFSTRAGKTKLLIGGEWRKEGILYDVAPLFGGRALFGADERTIDAAFAELQLPLLDARSAPGVDQLSISVAARYDRYSDVGISFNPQYGLVWRPSRELSLHASFTSSFRPPSLYELYSPPVPMVTSVRDPRRNHELADITLVGGGNPELEITKADSLTAGVAFTPRAWRDFRLAASYWQIDMRDRVAILPPPKLLDNEAIWADRIVRAPPSDADIAASLPGRLVSIDASRMNLGELRTRGVDFAASHTLQTPIGQFAPELSAVWVDEFVTTDVPGSSHVERVGIANLLGSIPRWRAVASLGWTHKALGVSTTARYVPSYQDANSTGPTGRTIPAQILVDAQVSLDVAELLAQDTPLRAFEIRLGVVNLFDETPHYAEVGLANGYDLSQGDLRQRFVYLKLSAGF